VIAVVVLATMRDQPALPREREDFRQHWAALGPGFKRFLWPAGVFALGYYSLGFMLVRAHALGFGVADIVLLYALFNTTCVIAAPLVGRLGDRIGRRRIVVLGYALYGLVNLGLVFADRPGPLVALFALYGLFYATEDSQSRAFIADLEPQRRATAIGLYNFVTGALYLPASLIAGALWTRAPSLAFGLAVALSLLAIGVFVALRPAPVAP
jgi:MFS family permease